ncbi:MAG: cupin domain-containing protein [Promethearchaeia archaeon]
MAALDAQNWPTWTTAGNPKWLVGKTNEDKEMPYGELSYVISGKLEIIPPSGERVIVQAGDFVTFPQGFVSTWTVLEELTWHYYLY